MYIIQSQKDNTALLITGDSVFMQFRDGNLCANEISPGSTFTIDTDPIKYILETDVQYKVTGHWMNPQKHHPPKMLLVITSATPVITDLLETEPTPAN